MSPLVKKNYIKHLQLIVNEYVIVILELIFSKSKPLDTEYINYPAIQIVLQIICISDKAFSRLLKGIIFSMKRFLLDDIIHCIFLWFTKTRLANCDQIFKE